MTGANVDHGAHNKPRAAVYCRVSTDGQERRGYSLKEQLSLLPKLARDRGYFVCPDDIYSEVMSGAKDERPEYNRMLARIIAGDYKAVFVVEKSRLGRTESRAEEDRVIKALQSAECVVHTPSTTFDPSTIEGEFQIDVMSAVDRQERKRIRQRMITGRLAAVKSGRYTGSFVPTGYDERRDDRGKRFFVINEAAMAPVRKAFDLALQGYSMRQIMRALADAGHLSKLGKPYGRTTIQRWIRNPHYAGFTHFGHGPNDRPGIKNRLLVDQNISLEPIITKADFERVQSMIEANLTRKRTKGGGESPLSGIILCPNCGSTMLADSETGRRVYRCRARNSSRPCIGDQPKQIGFSDAHRMALEIMPGLIKFLARHLGKIQADWGNDNDGPDEVAMLERQLQAVERRIMTNIRDQEDHPSEFRAKRIIELEAQYKAIKSKIRAVPVKPPPPEIANLDELLKVAETIKATDLEGLRLLFQSAFIALRWRRERLGLPYITRIHTTFGRAIKTLNGKYLAWGP